MFQIVCVWCTMNLSLQYSGIRKDAWLKWTSVSDQIIVIQFVMSVLFAFRRLRRSPITTIRFWNRQTLPIRTHNTQPSGTDSGQTAKKARRVELFGKFKDLFKKYGYVFVGTYLGVYVSTLASIFLALEMDVFSASTFGYDAQTLIQKVSRAFI